MGNSKLSKLHIESLEIKKIVNSCVYSSFSQISLQKIKDHWIKNSCLLGAPDVQDLFSTKCLLKRRDLQVSMKQRVILCIINPCHGAPVRISRKPEIFLISLIATFCKIQNLLFHSSNNISWVIMCRIIDSKYNY